MLSLSDTKISRHLACVKEILTLMQDENKTVHDDTVIERILSSFKSFLKISGNEEEAVNFLNEEDTASIFSLCAHIIANEAKYHEFTGGFAVRFFSIISSSNIVIWLSQPTKSLWMKCLHTILKLKISFCDISFQYAWLQALIDLLSTQSVLMEIVKMEFDHNQVFQLLKSRSIFVDRAANQALSKLVLSLAGAATSDNDAEAGCTNTITFAENSLHNLKNIVIKLQKDCSMETLIKVLTILLKEDYFRTCCIFNDYFNGDTRYFESNPNRKCLVAACEVSNAPFIHFIATLFTSSFENKVECGKIISLELANELVMSALFTSPLLAASYDMLNAVATFSQRNMYQYFEMICVPFNILLGEDTINEKGENICVLWRSVLERILISRSKVTTLLCNVVSSFQQLWHADLQLHDKIRVFKQFEQALSSVYELKSRPINTKPELLQNWKAAASIVTALQGIVSKEDRCSMCVNETLPNTLLAILRHADADYKVLSNCGSVILLLSRSNNCSAHTEDFSITIVRSLSMCLVQKLTHLRWQDRDSALGVIASLLCDLGSYKDETKTQVERILEELHMFNMVLSCMEDCNSYVRGAAILTSQLFIEKTNLCSHHCVVTLLFQTLNIIKNETEEFARRAAVNTFSVCILKSNTFLGCFLQHFVEAVLHKEALTSIQTELVPIPVEDPDKLAGLSVNIFLCEVLHDLDGDVKFNGVSFLRRLCEHIMKDDYTDIINLDKNQMLQSICSVLKTVVSDYDKKASELAQEVLNIIQPSHTSNNCMQQKQQLITEELNNLLIEVHYKMKFFDSVSTFAKEIDQDGFDDDVILDCY